MLSLGLLCSFALLWAEEVRIEGEGVYRGRTAAEWMVFLMSADQRAREDGNLGLVEIGAPAIPDVLESIPKSNPEIRRILINVLASVGPDAEEVVPFLLSFLKTENERIVRESVIWALSRIAPTRSDVFPVLIEGIKDPVSGALGRSAVARAGKMSIPGMLELINSENEELSRRASYVLSELGKDVSGAVPDLIRILKESKVPHVWRTTAHVLVKLGADANDALPVLLDALRDPRRPVRLGAIVALGTLGPKASAAAPTLIEALKDANKRKDFFPEYALGKMGPAGAPAVPILIDTLQSADAETVDQSIFALRDLGPIAKEAVPALISKLKDADQRRKSMVIGALEKIGPAAQEAMALLGEEIENQMSPVLREAVMCLGAIGPNARPAIPALKGLLANESTEIRELAIETILRIDPKPLDMIPTLMDQWKDAKRGATLGAKNALIAIGEPAVPALIQALFEPNNEICQRAADCLVAMGKVVKGAIHDLRRAYLDQRIGVYIYSEALGSMGSDARCAIPDLLEALRAKVAFDYADQATVIQALGKIANCEDAEVIRALIAALGRITPLPKPEKFVHADWAAMAREAAAEALGRIGRSSDDALEALITALKDPAPEVREKAAEALGCFGAVAKAALPNLQATAKSKNRKIRLAANRALGLVSGETFAKPGESGERKP